MTAAFELTRPEHRGRYHVSLYQVGWRLGGKGASGRGAAGRIEEHGFHVWMGFYENAFRLLRECYTELNRGPRWTGFADWSQAFLPSPSIGVADRSQRGAWEPWMRSFPPRRGLPGDDLTEHNPFSVMGYLVQTANLLRTLLFSYQGREAHRTELREEGRSPYASFPGDGGTAFALPPSDGLVQSIVRLLKYGTLATMAGLIEAAGLLEVALEGLSRYPENIILRLVEAIASNARRRLDILTDNDSELRRLWEVIDIVLATITGIIRFGLLYDPRGFDAIDEYDCRDWLRLNGASERSLNSAFVRGLQALAFAYEDGDPGKPRLAAGEALRGSLRMLFTYRGALFWKMRAGMGDVVFAPFYEVLRRRGVTFKFFHRLENVRLADTARLRPTERPYVEALEFDIQAEVKGGREYQPLVDVRGLPCWPSAPRYEELVNGERFERDGWDFESHWDRRKVGTKTLRVVDDFDFIVLGVGIGVIPYVCRDILARDVRWRAMVEHVKTVATQAFQLWMREDLKSLGWTHPLSSLAGFVEPFDTWADMGQLLEAERWRVTPRALAYFCSVLPDPRVPPDRADSGYPARRREEVRRNAIRFLNQDIGHLWPGAVRWPDGFRWDLLVDPREQEPSAEPANGSEGRFDSQFWSANVNPTDRYTLALPGSAKYRISPLDNTYDNLTITGDWTNCGYNSGCVEAAVMSGRLAAHAISHAPPLEDIIGYDHP